MPIVRTFGCEECGHIMDVTLAMEQCDDPPPACPLCNAWGDIRQKMHQEFKPVAINGSHAARAKAIAEDIVANDYHVADFEHEKRYEGTPKVRYKDQVSPIAKSAWGGTSHATLEAAIASGREMRLQFGSGLDVLQTNIKNGTEPDLIKNSKRLAMRVW